MNNSRSPQPNLQGRSRATAITTTHTTSLTALSTARCYADRRSTTPSGLNERIRALLRDRQQDDCAAWWGGAERAGREESSRAWKVSDEEIKARGYNLDIKNPHTASEDHGDPETLLEELMSAEAEVASVRDRLKRILTEALVR